MCTCFRCMGSQPAAVMPDVISPVPVSPGSLNLEVHTPVSLLNQQRSPRLPLNPMARSVSQENAKPDVIALDEVDGSSQWKLDKPGSETNSSETSPEKTSLFVREAVPLSGDDSTGNFVFADKVKNSLADGDHVEQNLEERLSHSNGFSFSLDNGLNHIGGKRSSYYKIRDLTSCDDLKLVDSAPKTLTHGRGSDPSLLANADLTTTGEVEEEEDNLPVFKEQTTELLRSWHEDDPSHYSVVSEVGSSERLEEVGVECDESFMVDRKTVVKNRKEDAHSSLKDVGKVEGTEQTLTSESLADEGDAETSSNQNNVKDTSESGKMSGLSLSELGINEDMFLNDVAFRTAALANQNCSFKMSFSRQSTEDEYH